MLSKESSQFHPSTSLLASDVTFGDGSVAVWLRNPKIVKELTGDVVEVWALPEKPALDPIGALKTYMSLREKKFGASPELPLFLHENGGAFTRKQMNQDLFRLLSIYPELNNARDKWTGHSYRSGISTLLALLGYKGRPKLFP